MKLYCREEWKRKCEALKGVHFFRVYGSSFHVLFHSSAPYRAHHPLLSICMCSAVVDRGCSWEWGGLLQSQGDRGCYVAYTWTLRVCKIMAFMAIFVCLGLLFYIILGFRLTFLVYLVHLVPLTFK